MKSIKVRYNYLSENAAGEDMSYRTECWGTEEDGLGVYKLVDGVWKAQPMKDHSLQFHDMALFRAYLYRNFGVKNCKIISKDW